MPRWAGRAPEPYPPPEPGEKLRMVGGPVDHPDPDPEAEHGLSVRRDGTTCDLSRTIAGMSAAPRSREDQVRWSGDVRNPTVADQAELLRDRRRM